MKNKTLFCFAFIFFIFLSPAFSLKKESKKIVLNSNWTFTLVEDAENYTSITPQEFNHLDNLFKNHQGYIWLKTTFVIPESFKNQNISLYLGQVKIASEVFLNDQMVGSSGHMPPCEFFIGEKPVYFNIPPAFINYGSENTLKIKLWVNSMGQISEAPYINFQNETEFYYSLNNLFFTKIPFAISIFLLLVSFLYLFFYFIRPVDRSNLSFALLTFFSSMYLLTICIGEYPIQINGNMLTFQKCFNAFAPFSAMYFAISFIRDFLEKKESKFLEIFRRIISVIVIIIPLFAKNLWQFHILQIICYIFSGFLFLYPVIIVLEELFKKQSKVKYLLLGFAPVLISLVVTIILLISSNFPFISIIVICGWQLTILIFLGMLLVNYVKLYGRFEFINSNLEKIVQSKTIELQNANKILENTNKHLEQERKRTEKEMNLAAQVQQNFYQIKNTEFRNWEICFYNKPMESVSGDLYDLYSKNKNLLGIGIFDVSGHGISSGLVTMLVKNIIQQEFLEGLDSKLTDVVYKINDRVIAEKGNIENYLTGIIGRIEGNNLIYVNAGHPDPIIISSSGNVEFAKKSAEFQCGVIGIGGIPTKFVENTIQMNKNDILILYTDGFIEAQNSEKVEFGKDKLLEAIESVKNEPITEIGSKIQNIIFEYTNNLPIQDDMTMVILRRK